MQVVGAYITKVANRRILNNDHLPDTQWRT